MKACPKVRRPAQKKSGILSSGHGLHADTTPHSMLETGLQKSLAI
jgi:hypothetical protein